MERLKSLSGLLLVVLLCTLPAGAGEAPPPSGTLCVLDFNPVGAAGGMEWLSPGLADMMIVTMGRTSPYRVVEREQLRRILREHRLAESGLLDDKEAVRAGRLARAGFLLTGSFSVQATAVTVQARLLRLADQKLVSRAVWKGPREEISRAPQVLSRRLLSGLGTPFDEKFLVGIEREIPRTFDAAASFYRGLGAFDRGDYPLALSRFLEALQGDEDFIRARRRVFHMYYLLDRSDHAVLFASGTARILQEDDLPRALEFLHLASLRAVDPLGRNSVAVALLERAVSLADEYDEVTGETEGLRDYLRQAAAAVGRTGGGGSSRDLLADHDVRRRIWTTEIPEQLERRRRSGGFEWVSRNGEWHKEKIPEPTVFMWRTRALQDLARLLAGQGRTEEALACYRRIVEDYSFVRRLLPGETGRRFYWDSGIRLEAHFMILRHYGKTGRLIRDAVLMPSLNEVDDAAAFVRDFRDEGPDPRARVWSAGAGGGHEYFDFAPPEGSRITQVVFEADVEGPAWLSVYLPDARGWPPRFDFSRRLEKVELSRGRFRRTFRIPRGTAFLSLSVLWGPRWDDSFLPGPPGKKPSRAGSGEITRWQALFTTASGRNQAAETAGGFGRDADRRLVDHYAGRWGWDGGRIVRENGPRFAGTPPGDVQAGQWIALAMNGDIAVYQQDTLRRVALPLRINTDDDEHDPWLVSTRDGGYALFWTRGVRGRPSGRFVARTRDFVRWESPRRLEFDRDPEDTAASRLEGNRNVARIRDGYLMFLDNGYVRSSPDLVRWEEPRRVFDYDGFRRTVLRTRSGRIWLVTTKADDREIPPGTQLETGYGYFTTSDGRVWQKREAVVVFSSPDGRRWTEGRKIHVGAEPTGLWALPVGEDAIAVAVGYGSLALQWLVSSDPQTFVALRSSPGLALNSDEAHFHLRDGKMHAVTPVHDFVNEEVVLLVAHSERLHESLSRAAP